MVCCAVGHFGALSPQRWTDALKAAPVAPKAAPVDAPKAAPVEAPKLDVGFACNEGAPKPPPVAGGPKPPPVEGAPKPLPVAGGPKPPPVAAAKAPPVLDAPKPPNPPNPPPARTPKQRMRDKGKPTAIFTAYAHGQTPPPQTGKTVAPATNSDMQQTAPEAAGAAPNAGVLVAPKPSALVAPKPAELVAPKAPKPPVAAHVLPNAGALLAAAGAPKPPLLVPKAGAAKPPLLVPARAMHVVASLVTAPT
jgi:hypothetical protein